MDSLARSWALNTIVAESLDYVATELEKATGGDPAKLSGAVQKLLQSILEQHGRVVFNGDGYSEAWHREAEKRGLPNLKTSVDALPAITSPDAIAVFEKYGVLSPREVHSRQDIYLEQYVKTVNVEAKPSSRSPRRCSCRPPFATKANWPVLPQV